MCRTVLEPYFAWENPALTGYGEATPQKGFGGLFPPGTGLPGVARIPISVRIAPPEKPLQIPARERKAISPVEATRIEQQKRIDKLVGKQQKMFEELQQRYGRLSDYGQRCEGAAKRLRVGMEGLADEISSVGIKSARITREEIDAFLRRGPLSQREKNELIGFARRRPVALMSQAEATDLKTTLIFYLDISGPTARQVDLIRKSLAKLPVRHLADLVDRNISITITRLPQGTKGLYYHSWQGQAARIELSSSATENLIHEVSHALADYSKEATRALHEEFLTVYNNIHPIQEDNIGGVIVRKDGLISWYAGRVGIEPGGRRYGVEMPSETSELMYAPLVGADMPYADLSVTENGFGREDLIRILGKMWAE